MPKVEFTEEYKTSSPFDYPKLTLRKNEVARVLLIDNEPYMEFLHQMQVPELVNGVPVMEDVQDRQGNWQKVPKMQFRGRVICCGDVETLLAKGVDPENCPACAESKRSSAIPPPKRRIAVHVWKYNTNPDGTVAEPFGGELLLWQFTDKRFNQIVGFRTEFGDLKQHDLKLGPCTDQGFQAYDMMPLPNAAWLADADTSDGKLKLGARGNLVAETFKSQKCEDPAVVMGRRVSQEQMRDAVNEVLSATQGTTHGTPSADVTATEVDAGIGSLDDLLTQEPPTAGTEEAAPTEAKETEEESGDALDLDQLLADSDLT